MSKILFSFVAFHTDFENGKASNQGPNYSFHQHFYDKNGYDKHLIVSQGGEEDIRAVLLLNKLQKDFPTHTIAVKGLHIIDVIDVVEIANKIQRLLLTYANDELHLFISPGTPAMHISWVLMHTSLGLNTHILQVRPKEFVGKVAKKRKQQKDKKNRKNKGKAKDKTKIPLLAAAPELLRLDIRKSSISSGLVLRQELLNKPPNTANFCLTPSLEPIYKNAESVAQADSVTVLILGESGTGKEHLARFIHQNSPRKKAPFELLNCSAMGDALLESRLFGYKKGSFTGADADTAGIFEQANGGTVFLDEIGDISPYMQQALLRVLQQKEIRVIGGKSKKVDVRIIAATNKDLFALCQKEKFRWDLYYRLAVADLELPPLRDRGPEEIATLTDFFIDKKQEQFRAPQPILLQKEVLDFLSTYPFPGNIRELENIIERFYVLNEAGMVSPKNLPKRLHRSPTKLSYLLEDVEKMHIQKVLQIFKGNKEKTSKALGVAYNTLNNKIKKYGMEW